MNKKSFGTSLRRLSGTRPWTERAVLRATEEICLAMEREKISRAELARRLGTSPAYVTKVLRGKANFTLATLARIAYALEGEFKFRLRLGTIAPDNLKRRLLRSRSQASSQPAPPTAVGDMEPSRRSPARGHVTAPQRALGPTLDRPRAVRVPGVPWRAELITNRNYLHLKSQIVTSS